MDMQHGRFIPATVAAAAGAVLFGAYVEFVGLDADIGNSPAMLVAAVAIFVLPGCASAIVMEWRARRNGRKAAFAIASAAAPAAPFVAVQAVAAPFPAAEAVADIRSLTEARVERRLRERRGNERGLKAPLAVS